MSKKNLTNTLISKAKPSDSPYEIRDAGLKGLLLRIQPSGVMTYYFEYLRGKRIKIGHPETLAPEQAREAARRIDSERRVTGKDPIKEKKRVQADNYLQFLESSYRPHLEMHLRNGISNKESVRETMGCLVGRFSEFHRLGLSEITPLLVDKWKQRRSREGVTPATINRQMNDLRACLNKAVEWGALEQSPLDKVKPCKVDSNPKVRYLSPTEEQSLRDALDNRDAKMKAARESANEWRAERGYTLHGSLDGSAFADHLKPAVLISLNTGLRRGELLKLKWNNVNLEQRTLTVEAQTAKAGKTRHIPLNSEALALFRAWKDHQPGQKPNVKSVYVFCDEDGQPFGDMRTSWEGLLERAKIKNFRWHDLRHTFASNLVIAGVDLNKVRALLGHSDYKMTLRYAHLAPDHMQDAVDKLDPANRIVVSSNSTKQE